MTWCRCNENKILWRNPRESCNRGAGMLAQDKNLTRAILSAIETQPGIRLAILFGSLATGREQVESDLDLAVDAGRLLTADEKLALINELAERTGRPVDLVDLHAVGEPLLGQILRHGKRLLGGGTCYAGLIRRHLFDQADYLPYRSRILAERRRAWIGK
jgi:predicted nucleotidyltransferase